MRPSGSNRRAAYEREQPSTVVEVRVREDQTWRINQVFGTRDARCRRARRGAGPTGHDPAPSSTGVPERGARAAVGLWSQPRGARAAGDPRPSGHAREPDRRALPRSCASLARGALFSARLRPTGDAEGAAPVSSDLLRGLRVAAFQEPASPQPGLDLLFSLRLDDPCQFDVEHVDSVARVPAETGHV